MGGLIALKDSIVDTTQPLNSDQQKAADGFFDFLFTPEKELIISGPGGVGKTFLMSHMIDKIMPKYMNICALMGEKPMFTDVNMTATTNKAAEVLAISTQRPTSTVHSFLGLKVKDDFKTGVSKLIPTNAWKVHEKKILFIDEGSMLDTAILKFVEEGTHNCKIVYVGDHCQLSPIMEKISPIYTRDLPFFELKEPMRTNIPELHALNLQLRETVETGVFKPIKIVPGIIDYLDDADMEEAIKHYFTNQTTEARILAYTNSRVIQYNDHIRYIRNQPDEWQVGERLINNSSIRLCGEQISVEQELEVISQDPDTDLQFIAEGVFLETRNTHLRSLHGGDLFNVAVPVDRNHFLDLIKHFARVKNWERMYFLKNTFPDLRQWDAATVHKSQGSTYDAVFIDLANISTCRQPDVVSRMLYVAASRARTRVFLYGPLADKYGGLTR